jgi:hypothetical protein
MIFFFGAAYGKISKQKYENYKYIHSKVDVIRRDYNIKK